MITEAFTLRCDKENAYLDIDRTYKYGGIMLLADALEGVCLGGIDGYTYFKDFSLNTWLNALGITDTVLTMEVSKDCDGMINSYISQDKKDDILSITVKDGTVTEVRNSNNETVYVLGDSIMKNWDVGWFGKIFDYYTNIISNSIEDYDEDYDSYIWGVFYL